MEVGLPKPMLSCWGSVMLGRVLGRGQSCFEPSRSQRQPLSRAWQGEWGLVGRARDSGRARGPRVPPGPRTPDAHPPRAPPSVPRPPVLSWGRRSLSRPAPFWTAWPAGSIGDHLDGVEGGPLTTGRELRVPVLWARVQAHGGPASSSPCRAGSTHLRNGGSSATGTTDSSALGSRRPPGAWWVQGLQCGGEHPRIVVSG